MSSHIVWSNTVDGGTWKVEVTAPDADWYDGTLTVTRASDNEVIHTEKVVASYGAPFGPDAADLAEWQQKCIAVIDAQEQ